VTRRTNARVAGFAFLFYIAVAFPSMILFERATSGEGIAAKLASIAHHATDIRIVAVLSLLSSFAALTLAVTLYAITRDEDRDLALLGMSCRAAEGVVNAIAVLETLALLWLGTNATDANAAQTLGALLFQASDWNTILSATLFAVGSTLFSYLLLRGRMVPIILAWLGVAGSVLLVLLLPLRLAGVSIGPLAGLMWLPMAVFEVWLALWLIIKGARTPQSAPLRG
jgi:hypothetical protein